MESLRKRQLRSSSLTISPAPPCPLTTSISATSPQLLNSQGRCLPHLPGQAVPLPHHSIWEEILISNLNLHWHNLRPLPLVLGSMNPHTDQPWALLILSSSHLIFRVTDLWKDVHIWHFFQTFLCTSNTNHNCARTEIDAEMLGLPSLIESNGRNFSWQQKEAELGSHYEIFQLNLFRSNRCGNASIYCMLGWLQHSTPTFITHKMSLWSCRMPLSFGIAFFNPMFKQQFSLILMASKSEG